MKCSCNFPVRTNQRFAKEYPLWMPLTTRVVKDVSKHPTQWYESQLITTELLFEARKLKKWILWILSKQFVV